MGRFGGVNLGAIHSILHLDWRVLAEGRARQTERSQHAALDEGRRQLTAAHGAGLLVPAMAARPNPGKDIWDAP